MLSEISVNTLMLAAFIRILELSNITIAYNNATVRCTAVVDTGATVLCSPDGLLGVQGECKDRGVA